MDERLLLLALLADGWLVDKDGFIFFIFVMVVMGVIKDLIMFGKWFDRRMQPRGKGHPDDVVTNDRLEAVINGQSEFVIQEIKGLYSARFDSILAETRKTNDLLFRLLLYQKVIAKQQFGIDIDP